MSAANDEAEHLRAAASSRSFRAFAALGVLGAALLAVNLNVLVARWYKRWDLTADRLYTLSPADAENAARARSAARRSRCSWAAPTRSA